MTRRYHATHMASQPRLKRRLAQKRSSLYMVRDFGLSWLEGRRRRQTFDEVERWVMFLGYPRSGHSLVGSLLNAHPDIVIAHQLHSLQYVEAGFKRGQLFSMVLRSDRDFERRGRVGAGYDYRVPNQWQGRVASLRVIGDKRGMGSTETLGERPELFARLEEVVGVPIRIVHVVRNPFDNVATFAKRWNTSLDRAADRYFEMCRVNHELRSRHSDETWLDVRHEDLIDDAAGTLRHMCSFLGVRSEESYISDAAGIVYSRPHRSRYETDWSPELRAEMETVIATYPFLSGYSFDEADEEQPGPSAPTSGEEVGEGLTEH